MPELPEVTTIVNQLQKEIVGSTIEDVASIDGYRTQPEFAEFRKQILGGKVVGVERLAKNIVIELGQTLKQVQGDKKSSDYVVIHLAMTGRLLLRNPDQKEDPWPRLIFELKVESGKLKELRFTDRDLFGSAKLLDEAGLQALRQKYGADPLNRQLTAAVFITVLRSKRTGIKRALLEQELVAGVGNIYASEALWMAQIHPETATDCLSLEAGQTLLASLRQILTEGIKNRGATLGDKMYLDLYGREGEEQNYFRVLGKRGQACPRCSAIINYSKIGGRQTFFCPACQIKNETKVIWEKPHENQLNLL